MSRTFLAAAALTLAALPLSAGALDKAQDISEGNLLSGKVQIEADSAYIHVSGPITQHGVLFRLPDAAAIAAYEAEWAAALALVQSKYPAKLKSWEASAELAARSGRSRPEKPIEPTPENFSIDPLDRREPVFFGLRIFSSARHPQSVSYLMKVRPGRYVYHGPVTSDRNGITGMCYCMGTVSFEAKAGVITDTGRFFPGGLLSFGLPESLKSYPSVQADFRAYGKMDNYFGVTVGRMPRVKGVLAYDRDKVIDLKAEAPAAEVPAAPAVAAPAP